MTAAKLSPLVPYFEGCGIRLYCSDYRLILPYLRSETVSALITDPPYGTTNIEWDKEIDWTLFWTEAFRLCLPKAPMALFASGKFVPKLINSNSRYFRYELIWEKNTPVGFLDANRRPLRSHEQILLFSKLFRSSTYNPQKVPGKLHAIGNGKLCSAHYGRTSGKCVASVTNLYHPRSILRFNNRSGKSLHPTQKPLDLMRWLVRSYSNRDDLILDPFAGSGSTLVAAAREGRRAIGIEQDRHYCDIIVRRLTEEKL